MMIKKFLSEVHLYHGKIEYMIKLLIWIFSWMGGIYVTKDTTSGVGSAFFVFSIALLMEFVPRIEGKKILLARILHSLFCFVMGAILILSSVEVLARKYVECVHNIMFVLSIYILIYMILDCLSLWLFNDNNSDNNVSDVDILKHDRIAKFNEHLSFGNLGDIE